MDDQKPTEFIAIIKWRETDYEQQAYSIYRLKSKTEEDAMNELKTLVMNEWKIGKIDNELEDGDLERIIYFTLLEIKTGINVPIQEWTRKTDN